MISTCMILSHSKKFIFQRTKKTAGTSIEIYFQPYCLPAQYHRDTDKWNETVFPEGIVGSRTRPYNHFYDHMPLHELRHKLGNNTWTNYFKFCSVRNPWDKAVSRFFWETRRVDYSKEPFNEIQRLFCLFIRQHVNVLFDDRNIYMENDQPCLDYYIRYEHLEEDMQTVCKKLDVPWEPKRFGRFKSNTRTRTEPYQDYYSDNYVMDLVARHARFDIQHFGYQF